MVLSFVLCGSPAIGGNCFKQEVNKFAVSSDVMCSGFLLYIQIISKMNSSILNMLNVVLESILIMLLFRK